MPTPPPEPVRDPVTPYGKIARILTQNFLQGFFDDISSYAYSTRSYMPTGVDNTEFLDALNTVRKFCEARPDWMEQILARQLPIEISHRAVDLADKKNKETISDLKKK